MRGLPLTTLSVTALSLVGTLSPTVAELLIYDRDAIGAGEVWRLLSGHLVHLTSPHLLADLTVFVVSGCLIERERGGDCGWLYLVMGAAIGVALWSLDTSLARFGGLSGLAYGNVAFLALSMCRRQPHQRVPATAILATLIVKLVSDFVYPGASLMGSVSQPFVSVPLAHLVGVLTAGAFFITTTKEYRHVIA